MTETPDNSLFNQHADANDKQILLEQYKLYVGSANQTSGHRSQANTLLLSTNTVLIGFIAGVLEFTSIPLTPYWIVFACIAGVLLCISWFFLLQSFRTLNSGRFAVIHELETKLPARIYTREWEIVMSRKVKYIRQTNIEQIIPIAFCILYIALAIALVARGV